MVDVGNPNAINLYKPWLYHPFMVVFGGMVYCWVATLIDADWIPSDWMGWFKAIFTG